MWKSRGYAWLLGATLLCALPSGVGNVQPSQSRSPPHWTWSPVSHRSSMPAYIGTTSAISTRMSWPDAHVTRWARSGSTRAARSEKISHSVRASPRRGPRIWGL